MFFEISLERWQEIHELADALSLFIFRGQASSDWPLSSSLERASTGPFRLRSSRLTENTEHWMLDEFKKRYHLHGSSPVRPSSHFEWLAVMQHHGCPTRLLDFTHSIYVALYFAVEQVSFNGKASIWCINTKNVRLNACDTLGANVVSGSTLKDDVNREFMSILNRHTARKDYLPRRDGPTPLGLVYVEPEVYARRVSSQQGLFVAPVNVEKAFRENMAVAYRLGDGGDLTPHRVSVGEIVNALEKAGSGVPDLEKQNPISIVKIVIPGVERRQILSGLMRMNITAETLFPGLDGLARSIPQRVRL